MKMLLPLLAVGVGALGIYDVMTSRKIESERSKVSGDLDFNVVDRNPPGSERRAIPLIQGQLYRVKLRKDCVPIAKASGFSPVLLSYADPTDPTVWTLLARWSGTALPHGLPMVLIPIDEPPALAPAESDSSSTSLGLDAALTPDEVDIVRHALAEDDDPKHLGGIASTFEPDFPVAAALLRAKAILTLAQKQRTRRCVGCGKPARLEVKDEPVCSESCATTEAAPAVARTLSALEKASAKLGRGIAEMWRKYEPALVGLGARVVPAPEPPPSAADVPPDAEALRRVISALTKDLALTFKTSKELSEKLGISEPLIQLAKSLVVVLPGGISLVRPAIKLPRPFTPTSALVLAHASMRPTVSRVVRPKKIGERLRDIRSKAKDGDAKGAAALEMLQRAEKALERKKWIDWRKRVKNAEKDDSFAQGEKP